jgi:hypothetical protein
VTLTLVLAGLAAVGSGAPSASAALSPLAIGFNDHETFMSPDAATRQTGFAHARAADAAVVRLPVAWSDVAPQRPPSRTAARDPAWAGYRWRTIDGPVRDAHAAGLRIVLVVYSAPRWAEGPHRPPVSQNAGAGSWRPDPAALGDFARAAAARYSGRFAGLPAVRDWEAWNEPNIPLYLSPQWQRVRGSTVPASPAWYRGMLNSFYAAVKSVSRADTVSMAPTSPFGDPPGGWRMQPAFFTRALFCVVGRGRRLAARRCPKVRLDALAHNPYSFGPTTKAVNADDVAAPDLWKLTTPLRLALRAGTVLPRRSKELWISETSWDTSPPDPEGVPEARQARFLEALFYVLWRQGADMVTWWQMRDQAEGAGWASTYQSGIYFRGQTVAQDQPKVAFTAFRFPFTAYANRGVAHLWGMSPTPGALVTIERQDAGGAWSPLTTVQAGANRLFLKAMRLPTGTFLRARSGADISLTWEVGGSPVSFRSAG